MIITLEDLMNAAPSEVQAHLAKVTVDKDLKEYLKWLDDNEVTTEVPLELKRNKSRSKGIHPSAACKDGACLLKLYYDCTHLIEPRKRFNRESQLTWDIGTMLHCVFQTWFKQMYGGQFKDEVFLRDEDLSIKSHADGLFTFSDHRFILEIKSIKEGGNYGFEKVQMKPMADNVRQAHFYMALSDAPFALLLYVCKNNSKWKEHAVAFDFKLWDRIVADVVKPVIETAYGDGEMVKASPGWGCRWCDYEYSCPEAQSYKSRGDTNATQNARKWARSSW